MRKWLILALTLAWLTWELIAAYDTSADTWPLTHLIIKYVPPWIYFPAALLLAGFLVWHFWPDGHSGRRSTPTNPREGIMTASASSPVSKRDAINRAVRTFIQGLWVTVTGAAVTAVSAALSGQIRWTKEYWYGVLLSVIGATAMAVASYIHRVVSPPPTS